MFEWEQDLRKVPIKPRVCYILNYPGQCQAYLTYDTTAHPYLLPIFVIFYPNLQWIFFVYKNLKYIKIISN